MEDQFNAALTAVAVADASRHYLRSVAKPVGFSDDQYQELLIDIAKAAVENHCQRAAEAREALARVIQYDGKAKEFYEDPQAVTDRPEEITAFLIHAKARASRSRRSRLNNQDQAGA